MLAAMVEREFLGWERPFLTQAAAWLLERRDELPGMLVVVPTAQSGRRLREALAEAAGALLAPKVVTPGSFLQSRDDEAAADWAAENLIVTRKCYLSLRAAHASRNRYDGVVVVDEAERALTISDVKHVLGVPVVAVVPYDTRISRSVDAGMLASRADQYAEYLKDVVKASVIA